MVANPHSEAISPTASSECPSSFSACLTRTLLRNLWTEEPTSRLKSSASRLRDSPTSSASSSTPQFLLNLVSKIVSALEIAGCTETSDKIFLGSVSSLTTSSTKLSTASRTPDAWCMEGVVASRMSWRKWCSRWPKSCAK